jgi:hypothetical protein
MNGKSEKSKKLDWEKYVLGFGVGFVVLFVLAGWIAGNFPDLASVGWTICAVYFLLVAFYLKYKIDY